MRMLTTILMLCLPMAAMGETFICETESSVYLSQSINNMFTENLTDWIVDTDSGFRRQVRTSDPLYVGECEQSEIFIFCSFEHFGGNSYISILISDGSFSYSGHSTVGIDSEYGHCTEI